LHTGFWWGNLTERDHVEDVGVDGRIILKHTFKKWDWGIDWIDLNQDSSWWLAVVGVKTNLRFA
jgi:hypothetical protein